MKNLNSEMIKKAKAAKSAEELLELAKASNVEMTADEAATYFAQLNPKSGELDDDDLDAVAGGGCDDRPKNSEVFPEGSKIRRLNGSCRRCGNNVWIAEYTRDIYGDCCITPRCCNCRDRDIDYYAVNHGMYKYYELIG